MKINKTLFYFIAGFLSPIPVWAEAMDISYDSLPALLEKRNTKLEALKLNVEAAKIRQNGYLGRSFMPSLELQLDQETFKKGLNSQKTQPSYSVEAKLNLYNGDRDRIENDVRELTTKVKDVHLKKATIEELLEARELYWDILYSQEKIDLLNSILKANTQNTESAFKRIRSGVAAESDKMEFEIKAVDLKQELDSTTLNLKSQLAEMKLLLNIQKETQVQLAKTFNHQHEFEASVTHTHSDHALETREAEIQSEMSDLQGQSQARKWWPKIDAIAGLKQLNEREDPGLPTDDERKESYIGLRLTMSLPEGLESNKESLALAKESGSLKKLSEYQHHKIHAHVDSEVEELKLLHSQVHEAEINITRAEKYYKLTQSEYTRGVKNSPDMLSATEKLWEVKLRRLDILKSFNQKQAHVLAKIQK